MEDIFTLTAREEIEIAVRLVLVALFGAAVGATSAIGMAVGSGLYIASIGGTALMLAILYLFAPARNSDQKVGHSPNSRVQVSRRSPGT